MPYIDMIDRRRVDEELVNLSTRLDRQSIGTLNYCIMRLCLYWVEGHGGKRYENFNAVIGCLECVKQEMYRREVAPYEDKKCEENGDVF